MSARQTEADRLRACRAVFARALADGVSMAEARARIVADARACGRAEHARRMAERAEADRLRDQRTRAIGQPALAPALRPAESPRFWWNDL